MKKIFAKAMVFVLAAVMALSLTACGVDITSVGLPASMQLVKGDTTQLTVDFGAKDGATEEAIAKAAEKLTLVWSSSDEAVASCLYTQIPEIRINTELFNHHQKTEYPYNHTENAF